MLCISLCPVAGHSLCSSHLRVRIMSYSILLIVFNAFILVCGSQFTNIQETAKEERSYRSHIKDTHRQRVLESIVVQLHNTFEGVGWRRSSPLMAYSRLLTLCLLRPVGDSLLHLSTFGAVAFQGVLACPELKKFLL